MAQGRFGILAEVLPPFEKRIRTFAIEAIRYGMTQRDPALINQAKKLGLITSVEIDGAEVYQLAEGLE